MSGVEETLPLRGRDMEASALRELLDHMVTGNLASVVIEGEAGIGKTRLLAETLSEARDRGAHVCSGRAIELERTRPFGLLADALGCTRNSQDPRRAAIATLLGTQTGGREPITVSNDPGLRFQVVDAFVDLVESLALDRAVLIGLDDVQWADPSSLMALSSVVRSLADLPVAIICCLRPFPRTAELTLSLQTFDSVGVRYLNLVELDERAIHDLVADSVAADPGPKLLAELAPAGGNPFFVTELLAAIGQEGSIKTTAGQSEVTETCLPPTLRLTILRRLSFLPDNTLEALRRASILGPTFSITDLSIITDCSVLDLSSALSAAIEARVLEDDGYRLRFRHDLIRDAVCEDIPRSVRIGLQREAGQRLAAAGAPTLQVAGHLARGAIHGDAEAIEWLTRAAREVAPRSPRVAADLLGRAADLTDPATQTRALLLSERAISLMWAGQLTEAEALCHDLLERDHGPTVDVAARICLAHMLIAQGSAGEALQQLEQVHRGEDDSESGAVAWAWAGLAHLSLNDLDQADVASTKALDATFAVEDHVAFNLAMSCLAKTQEMRAHLDDALELADKALRRADQSPGRQGHRYPGTLMRGHILLARDQHQQARSTLENGRRISEELGVRWALPSFQTYLALERFLVGHWDDANTEYEAALGLADETGERYSLIYGHSIMSLIAVHRGELEDARSAITAADNELSISGQRYRHNWLAWARALLLEAEGDMPQALTTLAVSWDECAEAGVKAEFPVIGPDLVRLALFAGDRARAGQVASAVAAVATESEVFSYTGAAERCRGLLGKDPDLMLSSADHYTRAGRPLESALAWEEAAKFLAAASMTDAAIPLIERALSTFEHVGASRDRARADSRLRELGVRRGRRGTRNRPTTGWASLTPTERKVVNLVTEGNSNPQIGERLFISRRTVQTHLSHVFTKLDLTSRAQLAAVAVQQNRSARGSD